MEIDMRLFPFDTQRLNIVLGRLGMRAAVACMAAGDVLSRLSSAPGLRARRDRDRAIFCR